MLVFLRVLLYLHIAAGFVGFFVAPLALAVHKGGAAHRRWGRVFFWAMVVAGLTALLLAGLKLAWVPLAPASAAGLKFLLLTGLFTLYLAGFGYRALYLKKLGQGQRPAFLDWLTVGAGLPVFGFFMYWGLRHGAVPAVVFGGIGLLTAARQLRSYLRSAPPTPGQWLRNHISGFMGAYIAAVSAFSATSLHFIPWPWNFLWPTLLGVPYLLWAPRRYVGAGASPGGSPAPAADRAG